MGRRPGHAGRSRTKKEAAITRRIAANIAKLPNLLRKD
jgi:hypothetical protein